MHRRGIRIEEEVRHQFSVARSNRAWKEQAVAKLLGPVFIQLDRTARAFKRWKDRNLFLESEVIRKGNLAIRDLLLSNPHLIPPELLEDASVLIEHYDRWLEEYEKKRGTDRPDLESPFVFVGPAGYPFPLSAEQHFREKFREYWKELYGAA